VAVAHISEIPSFPPNPIVYPLFANAVYAEVHLNAGDMLYIPRRWWHWVTSYDRNIALSLWHAADKATLSVDFDRESVSEIDSIANADEFQTNYFLTKRPVVIRSGHVKEWPAFTKWTDEYLTERNGTAKHYVGISPEPHVQATRGDHTTRVESLTMSEFLELSRTSTDYLWLAQSDEMPRLLASDWTVPGFWEACCGDKTFRTAFWFAFARDRGLTSSLHYDYYENLLTQVAGAKRVLLFSPAQSPYLYRRQQELISSATEATSR